MNSLRFALLLTLAATLAAQITGAIEGFVLNTATGWGMAGARVSVEPLIGRGPASAFTDDNGSYRVAGLAEGDYILSFEKNGFVFPRGPRADSLVHVVSDGTARLNGALAPWPNIRGRVFDPEGKPVAGAKVRIVPALDGETTTGAGGDFEFTRLKPGSYVLSASPRVKVSSDPPAAGERIEVVRTFFPSVIASGDARRVLLEGGDDVSGIDIHLRIAPIYSVRGVVLDESGKTVEGAKVIAFQLNPQHEVPGLRTLPAEPKPVEEIQAESERDGGFEFPSLVSGDWRVQARTSEYNDELHRKVVRTSASIALRLPPREGETLELTVHNPTPIAVSVRVDNPDKAPGPFGSVYLEALEGQGSSGANLRGGPLDSMLVTPGRFRPFPLGAARGAYVAQILLGGRDVMGQEIEISGPAELTMVFKTDGGAVRGKVRNGSGAIVAMMPASGNAAYSRQVSRSGEFSLRDVPPGDYDAAAYEPADIEMDGFLAAFHAKAKRVHVESGAVANVDLELIR